MNKKIWGILVAVTLMGAGLRLWQLGKLPALNADEAAIGYNAYSLLLTGKDEYGNPWPVHFTSFADYKPGGYFYLVLPWVAALGLDVWAVRLPSVLLGILCLPLIYLVVREMFPGKGMRLGLLAAGLAAVSPWQVHFGRGGWEVNVATFFIILGVWGWLAAGKKAGYYFLFVLAFLAALYTYHAARVVGPFLAVGLVVIYRERFLPIRKKWGLSFAFIYVKTMVDKKATEGQRQVRGLLAAGLVGVVLAVPLILSLWGPAGVARAGGVGLFADEGPFWRVNDLRGEHGGGVPQLVVRGWHNRVVTYGWQFLTNWAAHYSGDFLFISGDAIQRNKVPETGLMLLPDVLLLVVGGIILVKWWVKGERGAKLLGWWLAVAPIPAALTFQSPHALRAQGLVVPLVILAAMGADGLVGKVREGIKRKKVRWGVYGVGLVVYGFFVSAYVHNYFWHLAGEYPYATQWGFEELVNYLESEKGKYDKVYVTDRYDQPYILTLFYSRYPPAKFQQEATLTARDKFGFGTVRRFDKYVFTSIKWGELRDVNGILIAGTDEEIPEVEANVVKRIYFPNGKIAFEIVAR